MLLYDIQFFLSFNSTKNAILSVYVLFFIFNNIYIAHTRSLTSLSLDSQSSCQQSAVFNTFKCNFVFFWISKYNIFQAKNLCQRSKNLKIKDNICIYFKYIVYEYNKKCNNNSRKIYYLTKKKKYNNKYLLLILLYHIILYTHYLICTR